MAKGHGEISSTDKMRKRAKAETATASVPIEAMRDQMCIRDRQGDGAKRQCWIHCQQTLIFLTTEVVYTERKGQVARDLIFIDHGLGRLDGQNLIIFG